MSNEANIGFVPVKPASAICNLFSNDAFDDVASPMSELAKSLELSKVKIARRKLSLSSDCSIPTPERLHSLSSEFLSEKGINSPLSECPDVDSPIIEYIRTKNADIRRKCSSRSFSSPLTRKPLAPLTLFSNNFTSSPFKPVNTQEKDDIKEEKHSDLSICEMEDRVPDIDEGFRIKRRSYIGRPHSAPTVKSIFDNQPYCESTEDERFFGEDLLKSGESNMSPSCPSTFFELVDGPIVQSKNVRHEYTEEDKENFVPCKEDSPSNHVFAKPTGIPFKQRSISCSVKRGCESPKRLGTKRLKTKCGRSQSFFDGNAALVPIPPISELKGIPSPRTLQRSQSFDLHNVRSGYMDVTEVDMDDKSLLGDKSKAYLLPTTSSKHPDLKGITCHTLVDVLNGKYNDSIEEYIIVDCRYPYEFDGGHIRGAVNIHDKPSMIDYFLKSPRSPSEKRRIIIFHCEFSSKRGPAMCRFLRNKDRDVHLNYYPQLYYPELYLLEGGYKEFYEKKKEYCEPQGYREMSDVNYHQELRLFSKRSKSWSEENSLRNRTSLRY